MGLTGVRHSSGTINGIDLRFSDSKLCMSCKFSLKPILGNKVKQVQNHRPGWFMLDLVALGLSQPGKKGVSNTPVKPLSGIQMNQLQVS